MGLCPHSRMNPIVQEKVPPVPIRKLPIRVEIVVKVLEDAKALKAIQEFKSFCQNQQILVETRVYDSYRFRYDRDEIVSLPAFHIYVNSHHEKTFYPAHRPYQIVTEMILEYKRRIQEKQAKKSSWKKKFVTLWKNFINLGKRKTRMEREQEFQERAMRISYEKEQADLDRRIKIYRIATWN